MGRNGAGKYWHVIVRLIIASAIINNVFKHCRSTLIRHIKLIVLASLSIHSNVQEPNLIGLIYRRKGEIKNST